MLLFSVKFVRAISEHIKGHRASGQGDKTYSIIFVPRRTFLCERELEELGMQSTFSPHNSRSTHFTSNQRIKITNDAMLDRLYLCMLVKVHLRVFAHPCVWMYVCMYAHTVYVDIPTSEYHLDLVPFDEDVLSMELNSFYKECCLEGDHTALLYIARALIKLQKLFGIIPTIRGKGALSLVWLCSYTTTFISKHTYTMHHTKWIKF
jgi:hypothetical protein